MLNNEGQAATAIQLLQSASAANTAGATGSWIDARDYEGDIVILQNVGAVTGSITGKIQDATDGSGTGAADLSGAAFATVSSSTSMLKITVPAGSHRGWIRYVGTVVTGPSLVGVAALARPKIV